MDPREFQRFAFRMVTSSDQPAQMRTAVSRAYYAVFNVGVEHLERLGFKVNKGPKGHHDVINRLSNSGDPDVERVGSQLTTLQHKRIQADYRLNEKNIENPNDAKLNVMLADRLISTLDQRCSSPNSKSLVAAIKNWEKATGLK